MIAVSSNEVGVCYGLYLTPPPRLVCSQAGFEEVIRSWGCHSSQGQSTGAFRADLLLGGGSPGAWPGRPHFSLHSLCASRRPAVSPFSSARPPATLPCQSPPGGPKPLQTVGPENPVLPSLVSVWHYVSRTKKVTETRCFVRRR